MRHPGNNWAVLVETSKYWYNYRHAANVGSLDLALSLRAMASTLLAMASNLIAMASNLIASVGEDSFCFFSDDVRRCPSTTR